MKGLHNFGLNVIDLESITNQALESRGGKVILPNDTVLVVHDLDGQTYYAKIDQDNKKIEDAGEGRISMILDEKYDLDGRLTTEKPESISNPLDVTVKKKSGGGGAHNAAYGQGVFLEGHIKAITQGSAGQRQFGDVYKIKPYIHVMHGDDFIEDCLPRTVNYHRICECENDAIGRNLILTVQGRKVTLRSNPVPYDKKHADSLLDKIHEGDVLFLNTVKENDYLEIAERAIQSGKLGKFILAATDSMIAKVGKEKIQELIGHSDVYISNVDEMSSLTGIDPTDQPSLIKAMDTVRELQLAYNHTKKRPHMYITFGEAGAAAMDISGNIFYQPCIDFPINTPLAHRIVNTNGCGDAFASIVGTLESAGLPTIEILDYANTAGQICSQIRSAIGSELATPGRIADFTQKYGNKPIKLYDRPQGDFTGSVTVHCRF
ncbi:hypothetical protein GF323_05020 [Candidatus Woesearchaeota archaeon]|nr:hypothetical protein [Candidatus Woesearchaeota archaeon]